jgi:cytosine/uracil/thiamine/allantoin permease
MNLWGWLIIGAFAVGAFIVYACCVAAGKADEEYGIK